MANRRSRSLLLIFSLWGVAALLATKASAREATIRIVGNGASALYIEQGETQQKPVAVSVGDMIVWVNEGNRTHTATAEDDDGGLLFDTGDIAPQDQSDPVEMTHELFAKAGGEPGESVSLQYFCDHHFQMKSSLVLNESPARPPGENNNENLRKRRDITRLNSIELNRYRDAWRRIQRPSGTASTKRLPDITGAHGNTATELARESSSCPGIESTYCDWNLR